MADVTSPLADALTLALRLSPLDKIRLVEKLAATLEQDLAPQPAAQLPAKEGWGQQLTDLLTQLDLSDWDADPHEDPVLWVEQQRREQEHERQLDWNTRP